MTTNGSVAAPLRIGPHAVTPPVVLAPMAGITNSPFRRLCRQYGGGLYVSEMITTRALVERDAETMRLIEFAPDESPRSLQLYGVDPHVVREAVTMLVAEDRADHIDLNFGCPVPKVTRRGGGAALPWKRDLLRAVLRAAVTSAGPVPVTMKMRIGIDDDHHTFLDAGRIAEEEGIAAVALHGRTAAQAYSGQADWSAVARLKEHVTSVPVLGNGDVWEAADALAMMRSTGCDGVVVGRGCLGRPWLFRSLDRAFSGLPDEPAPNLGEVAGVMRLHAGLMAHWAGEDKGAREFRKHVSWYLKGFGVGGDTRQALGLVSSLVELDDLLATLDASQPFPAVSVGAPRGRLGPPRRVVLPEGWLDDRSWGRLDAAAELAVSGG
ncbi:MAG: tRNA dihydrouridine synthase DusB [Spirochaetaceae bacterium]|nr:tRNA dihydrouridine synthase DusB [Spirochaetaceae bacterium]